MGTLPLNAVVLKDGFASSLTEAVVAEPAKSLACILFMMGSLLNGMVLLSTSSATFEWFPIPKHHALKQSDPEDKDASDTEDDEENDDDADDQDDDDDNQDNLSGEEGKNEGAGDDEPQANGDGASGDEEDDDDDDDEDDEDDDDDDDDDGDDGDEKGEEEEEEEDEEDEEEEILQPPAKRRK